jgi:geranylgeranyl diphosphate synthase, type II
MIAHFEQQLQSFIQANSPHHDLTDVLLWSTLPAGKLFRPKIFYALLNDLNAHSDQNALHVAMALELHHAYTLVHDDLPCMDDDQYRRGKLSTHAKYGEWKAVLTGDALLNLSYQALAQINHPAAMQIIQLFTQNLGAGGLILGQWLDLEFDQHHHAHPIEHILKIHHLKTGLLISTALNSAAKLTGTNQSFDKLAHALGICFQLLDDLSELTDTISEHEKKINPFFLNAEQATAQLSQQLNILLNELNAKPNLQKVIREYLIPMKNKISSALAEEILNVVKIIEKF